MAYKPPSNMILAAEKYNTSPRTVTETVKYTDKRGRTRTKQQKSTYKVKASVKDIDEKSSSLPTPRKNLGRLLLGYVILILIAVYWLRLMVGNTAPDFSFTRLLSGLAEWSETIDLSITPVKWNLPEWLNWLNDFANLIWLPLGYGANFISALISFIIYLLQFFLFL